MTALPKVSDTRYRYDYHTYGHLDEFGDTFGRSVRLELYEFEVTKVTPCGVKVKARPGSWRYDWRSEREIIEKWSNGLATKKRFAHPTKQQALESFIARKTMQKEILTNQKKEVSQALAIAKSLEAKFRHPGQTAGIISERSRQVKSLPFNQSTGERNE